MAESASTRSPRCALRVRGLVKDYAAVRALAGIDFDVAAGELFALLGPSGCGKTTVLRSIAGIVQPDAGAIELDGKAIGHRPMYARDTALVFQNYALFPHLSVFDNVAFGLRMRKRPKAEVRRRVDAALDLVRLPGVGARLPHQLSGGQQQRIALARALVVEPAVLLLDEPLSNLDASLREEMRGEIVRLQRTLQITTVLVTHDIAEALSVADRIAVLRDGRVEQVGTPHEIYAQPTTRFVAEFVGHCNRFDASVAAIAEGTARLALAGGLEVPVTVDDDDWHPGQRAWVVVPRERIRIGTAARNAQTRHPAVVEAQSYYGSATLYTLRVGDLRLVANVPSGGDAPPRIGEQVTIGWDHGDVFARHDG